MRYVSRQNTGEEKSSCHNLRGRIQKWMVLRHWAIVLNNLWLCCSSNEIPGTVFVIVTAHSLQPQYTVLKTKIYTKAFCWKLPTWNIICDIVSLWCSFHGNWSSVWLTWSHHSHLSDRLLAGKLIHDSQRTCLHTVAGMNSWVKWQRGMCWSDDLFVCHSHWEAFHTCALTALSDCQEEVSSIWETLRQDSRKMRFQGSLFDLCSPSSSPSISSPLAAFILPLIGMLITTGPCWSLV